MTCTLEALPLVEIADVHMLGCRTLCTHCHATGNDFLKVTCFLPVGRGMHLASETFACPSCERLVIDAAHHATATASPRHMVRTVAPRGKPGRALTVVCDTSERAA